MKNKENTILYRVQLEDVEGISGSTSDSSVGKAGKDFRGEEGLALAETFKIDNMANSGQICPY